jgi:hypothetical protein
VAWLRRRLARPECVASCLGASVLPATTAHPALERKVPGFDDVMTRQPSFRGMRLPPDNGTYRTTARVTAGGALIPRCGWFP